jgi:hypothetical protein
MAAPARGRPAPLAAAFAAALSCLIKVNGSLINLHRAQTQVTRMYTDFRLGYFSGRGLRPSRRTHLA